MHLTSKAAEEGGWETKLCENPAAVVCIPSTDLERGVFPFNNDFVNVVGGDVTLY